MRSIPPAVAVSLALGISGLGFAIGNLLFARALPAVQYGTLALVIALSEIGKPGLPPLGEPADACMAGTKVSR